MSGGRQRLAAMPHWVYRLFDDDRHLIYVGCTSLHPLRRITDLRGQNPVLARQPVAWWLAHKYRNGLIAETIEGILIDRYAPPLNRMRSGVWARTVAEPEPPIDTDGGRVPGVWPMPSLVKLDRERAERTSA